MRNHRIAAAACIVCVAVPPLSARVVVKESASTTVNGKTTSSEIVYSVKGSTLRVHQNHPEDPSPTGRIRIYDAAAGRLIVMDRSKQEADVYDAAKASAEVEKKLSSQRISVDLKPVGATRTLLGVPCEEYSFVLKAPMTNDVVLVRSGTAWIAKQGPGVADYVAFFRSAAIVLVASSVDVPSAGLATDRTETELYRRIADLGGLPYAIDMKLEVEGHGITASMLRKMLAASRSVTTTSVDVEALGDELFAIPAGWKIRNK